MMDELYKALETIQQHCLLQNYCEQCLLRGREEGTCAVRGTTPNQWQLDNKEIPRLIK